jgi:RNA polymerase sigma-70 factor (ECF subfamily)
MTTSEDMTQLLFQAGEGDQRATDGLLTLVYDELRQLAGGMMRRERLDHTLQGTALVHEAYLKLIDQRRAQWQNRAHFFAVAAQAIRCVLVDHARGHRRHRRGRRTSEARTGRGTGRLLQAGD